MKKLLLILLFSTSLMYAQKIEEYKASNNIIYKVGDTIKLGNGSGNQGTFVYLKLGGLMAGSATQIGSAYAGLNVIIKKMRVYKFKGSEKIYFSVGGGNLVNYTLEIEEAISVCEIKDCNSGQNESVAKVSKYDELKKLKALHDEGILTTEEYESEKKKILSN